MLRCSIGMGPVWTCLTARGGLISCQHFREKSEQAGRMSDPMAGREGRAVLWKLLIAMELFQR